MKKFLSVLVILSMFLLCGCGKTEEDVSKNNIINVNPVDGKIVIDTTNITSDVSFVNYDSDGVIIQFIVVRGTDGVVRIAFNTCQACSPSPRAYFVQEGEYLKCENCASLFHIDKIGVDKDGCNPLVVEEKEEEDNMIIISTEYADSVRDKFVKWNGITE